MEYLSDFVQVWNDLVQAWGDFRAQPYSDTLLVVAGALLTLYAVIRIVKSSLATLFWVLLAGGGILAMMHGGGRAPWESRSLAGVDLDELVERKDDVLELLCDRLRESRGEYRVSPPPADTAAPHLFVARSVRPPGCPVAFERPIGGSAREPAGPLDAS